MSEKTHEKSATGMTHRQIMTVMVGLMMGLLLAALDQSIVSTALKTITVDLGGLNHYTWGRHGLSAHLHSFNPALRKDLRPLRPQAGLPICDYCLLDRFLCRGRCS